MIYNIWSGIALTPASVHAWGFNQDVCFNRERPIQNPECNADQTANVEHIPRKIWTPTRQRTEVLAASGSPTRLEATGQGPPSGPGDLMSPSAENVEDCCTDVGNVLCITW